MAKTEPAEIEVVPLESTVGAKMTVRKVSSSSNRWYRCDHCKRPVFVDLLGEYYHLLDCKKSNGREYGNSLGLEKRLVNPLYSPFRRVT